MAEIVILLVCGTVDSIRRRDIRRKKDRVAGKALDSHSPKIARWCAVDIMFVLESMKLCLKKLNLSREKPKFNGLNALRVTTYSALILCHPRFRASCRALALSALALRTDDLLGCSPMLDIYFFSAFFCACLWAAVCSILGEKSIILVLQQQRLLSHAGQLGTALQWQPGSPIPLH